MIERRCRDCAWFEPMARERRPGDRSSGECRRSVPDKIGWPQVQPEEWCGDFFAREADRCRRETGSA